MINSKVLNRLLLTVSITYTPIDYLYYWLIPITIEIFNEIFNIEEKKDIIERSFTISHLFLLFIFIILISIHKKKKALFIHDIDLLLVLCLLIIF